MAALHGAVRRDALGVLRRVVVDPGTVARMQARVAGAMADLEGLFVETKETGLALHYRVAPEHIEEARRHRTASQLRADSPSGSSMRCAGPA